jgi:hypothetical protein
MWLATSVASCGDNVTTAEKSAARAGAGAIASGRGAAAAPAAARRDEAPQAQPTALQSAWAAQKLIRTADVSIEVDSVERAIDQLDGIARQFDALVADVRVSHNAARGSDAQLTVRVPAAQFAPALAALKRLGDIKRTSVSTEDVTKAYADLETRLAVTEETVKRLRALLADRTGKLTDVLEVERELARVVTQLEAMKGERRYYDQRVAISTIAISLYEPNAIRRPGFVSGVRGAFQSSITALTTSLELLIYLLTFVAPWALIASLAWWIRQRWRARRHEM